MLHSQAAMPTLDALRVPNDAAVGVAAAEQREEPVDAWRFGFGNATGSSSGPARAVPSGLPEMQAVTEGEIRRLPSWQKNSGWIFGRLFDRIAVPVAGRCFVLQGKRSLRVRAVKSRPKVIIEPAKWRRRLWDALPAAVHIAGDARAARCGLFS